MLPQRLPNGEPNGPAFGRTYRAATLLAGAATLAAVGGWAAASSACSMSARIARCGAGAATGPASSASDVGCGGWLLAAGELGKAD
jgi:hypothetical protein